jgi:hypothetical protein
MWCRRRARPGDLDEEGTESNNRDGRNKHGHNLWETPNASSRWETALFTGRSGRHDELIHVLFELGAIRRPIRFVIPANILIAKTEQHIRIDETSRAASAARQPYCLLSVQHSSHLA